MKKSASLLERVDATQAPGFLLSLMFQEVSEVKPEIDAENPRKINGEASDVLVFSLSHAGQIGKVDEAIQRAKNVNGLGKGSDIYDLLVQAAGDAVEGESGAIEQVVAVAWSLMKHLPEGIPAALRDFAKTIEKVLSNRPPELYSDLDEDGTLLSDEDCRKKYFFLESRMRMIRNKVGRTLRSSDWSEYRDYLKNGWRVGSKFDVIEKVFFGDMMGTSRNGVLRLH